jgi:hypothetical protein
MPHGWHAKPPEFLHGTETERSQLIAAMSVETLEKLLVFTSDALHYR